MSTPSARLGKLAIQAAEYIEVEDAITFVQNGKVVAIVPAKFDVRGVPLELRRWVVSEQIQADRQ